MEAPFLPRVPRAPRFPLPLLLRYRCAPATWCEATTLNVSRSGLLARLPGPVPPDGDVDLVLTLPPCDAFPGARVQCVASVVRRPEAGLIALAIRRYCFLRPGEADAGEVGEWNDAW